MTSAHALAGAPDTRRRPRGFTRYAWFVLAYLLAVILFGAWVRITGSGAGCGSHWPMCHGEVIPRSAAAETIIEWSHRATSGVLGFLVLGLLIWGYEAYPRRSRVRAAVLVTFGMTLFEAAVGAGLVLGELVANDDSVARAIVIGFHLVSTFTLTAAAALAAWWSSHDGQNVWSRPSRQTKALFVSLAAVLIVSIAGAVTALGDTLFPVMPTTDGGLFSALIDGLDPAAHFLVRLRVVHPILSVIVAGALVALPTYLSAERIGAEAARLVEALRIVVLAQLFIGSANILLGAPGWMQIFHLLAAQSIWLLLVLTAAASLDHRAPSAGAPALNG